MSFHAGDVVVLKSGGPRMTIEWVEEDKITQMETAGCTWFEEVSKRQVASSRKFSTILLEKWVPMGPLTVHRG